MNRRDALLALLALSPLAMPLRVSAQQANRVYRVVYLSLSPPRTPGNPANVYYDAFLKKMNELGYVEGKNFIMEWRLVNGDLERLAAFTAEAVQANVDVIVTTTSTVTKAAQRATSTIPIVNVSMSDPVGTGIVKNLARPEGNVTGNSMMIVDYMPKQVELLAATFPRLSRIACLTNPTNFGHPLLQKAVQTAAQKVGAQVLPIEAQNQSDIDAAFVRMSKWGAQAVVVLSDVAFIANRRHIAQLALNNKVPTISSYVEDVEIGFFMFFGPLLVDSWLLGAEYVAKILKGAKPSDLPIQQATTFQFGINMKTAKALGVKVPSTVLMRADRVIE